jgi:penicillin amidase
VLSANQHPTYPDYPYYYNGYYNETRANRIHHLLETKDDLDAEQMKAIQLDNTNGFASEALPRLLLAIDSIQLPAHDKQLLQQLRHWKGTFNAGDENAFLFTIWWNQITDLTWDELRNYTFYLHAPDEYVLLKMIVEEPSSIYFDRMETPQKENAADIIREAFIIASKVYEERKRTSSVKWADCNPVSIMHPTNIPALSEMHIPSAGCPEAINAISENWGPSWRMIVELGEEPKAYGIYPGGQSGNPGSPYYDNFIKDWNQSKYYPLHYYPTAKKAAAHSNIFWTLK